jgi:hypothetical protein
MPYAIIEGGSITSVTRNGKAARRIAKRYGGKSVRISESEARQITHAWTKNTNSAHGSYAVPPAVAARMRA